MTLARLFEAPQSGEAHHDPRPEPGAEEDAEILPFMEGDLNTSQSPLNDSTLPGLDGRGLQRRVFRDALRTSRQLSNGPYKAQVLHVYPRGTLTAKPVVVARIPEVHGMIRCPGTIDRATGHGEKLYQSSIKSHIQIASFEAETEDEDTPGVGDFVTCGYTDISSFSGGTYRWRMSERSLNPTVLRTSPPAPANRDQLDVVFAQNTGPAAAAPTSRRALWGRPGCGGCDPSHRNDVTNIILHSTTTPQFWYAERSAAEAAMDSTEGQPSSWGYFPYGYSHQRALARGGILGGTPSDRCERGVVVRAHTQSEFWAAVQEWESTPEVNRGRTLREAAADEVVARWSSTSKEVSTHFIIMHDGTIIQLLPLLAVAWHCTGGANLFSVGIDLEGAVDSTVEMEDTPCERTRLTHTPEQFYALRDLVESMEFRQMTMCGHRHFYATRTGGGFAGRSDPGDITQFPWDQEPFRSMAPPGCSFDPREEPTEEEWNAVRQRSSRYRDRDWEPLTLEAAERAALIPKSGYGTGLTRRELDEFRVTMARPTPTSEAAIRGRTVIPGFSYRTSSRYLNKIPEFLANWPTTAWPDLSEEPAAVQQRLRYLRRERIGHALSGERGI